MSKKLDNLDFKQKADSKIEAKKTDKDSDLYSQLFFSQIQIVIISKLI